MEKMLEDFWKNIAVIGTLSAGGAGVAYGIVSPVETWEIVRDACWSVANANMDYLAEGAKYIVDYVDYD